MHIFHNRPMAGFACFFALASVISMFLGATAKWCIVGAAALGLLIVLLCVLKKKECRVGCAWCILLLLAALVSVGQSLYWINGRCESFREKAGEMIWVEGSVKERLTTSPYGSSFDVVLDEIDGSRTSASVRLHCSYRSALQPGDRFRLLGTVPQGDEEDFISLLSDGAVGELLCESSTDCTVLEEKEKSVLLYFRAWRIRLVERLSGAVGGENGDLAAALLLGDKNDLNGDTTLAFRRAGISHLLALSGLHVSVLMGILEWILRRFRIPKQIRAVIVVLAAGGYLLLTGCSLSTLRSVAMVAILYIGYLLGESYDSFTALCTTLLGILLITPYAVADTSMWLSFSATAGIVVFLPVAESLLSEELRKRLPRWFFRSLKALAVALAVGFFANAAILVLSALFFGSTSVFSVPLTMVLSPLLPPALMLAILVVIFPACPFLSYACGFFMELLQRAANRVSDIPNGTVLLGGSFTCLLLFSLVCALLLCAVLPLRRKLWTLLLPLLSVAVLLSGYYDVLPQENGIAVCCIADGKREAIVLAQGHSAVVIDVSDGSTGFVYDVRLALQEVKCTEVQELVLTHYHSKMSAMLAQYAKTVKIRKVLLPTPLTEEEHAIAARLEQEAVLHGCTVQYGIGVQSIPGVYGVELLRDPSTSGDAQMLLKLKIGDSCMVYTSAEVLDGSFFELARAEILSCDLWMIGSHGCSSFTGVRLLEDDACSQRILFASPSLLDVCGDLPRPLDVSVIQDHCFFYLS